MLRTKRALQARRRQGFTAVEIAMVASVIAILALLILPVFRQRAEEAKIAAANDELQSIAKAALLIEADMGGDFTPMLSDFDNRSGDELNPANSVARDIEPPRLNWLSGTGGGGAAGSGSFEVISQASWESRVISQWQGPYLAVRNAIPLAGSIPSVETSFPQLTWNPGSGRYGPIRIPGAPFNADDLANERYPVDPWGRPYLFFGPDTDYNVRSAFSLGPNGLPGNVTTPTGQQYNRRERVLGTGDDLFFEF